jgi:hypothetical protein
LWCVPNCSTPVFAAVWPVGGHCMGYRGHTGGQEALQWGHGCGRMLLAWCVCARCLRGRARTHPSSLPNRGLIQSSRRRGYTIHGLKLATSLAGSVRWPDICEFPRPHTHARTHTQHTQPRAPHATHTKTSYTGTPARTQTHTHSQRKTCVCFK